MKRQSLTAGAAAAVAAAVLAACGSSGGGSNGSLVFANYGGEAQTAMQKYWMDPFAKQEGITGKVIGGVDTAKIKAMVDAKHVTWDVIEDGNGDGAKHCGTLYEKLSSKVDLSSIDPNLVNPDNCGVPILLQSIVLVYNKAKFGNNPPTKLADYLDTKKFPGKRLAFNVPVGTIEPVLLADGVSPDKLYPLDIKRFFAATDKLGSDLVLQDSLGQQVESIASGDYAMTLAYNGRLPGAADQGAKFGVIWDKSFQLVDTAYVVKGSKNKAKAMDFLNYIATPKAQEALTKGVPYGPTTSNPTLPAGVATQYLPSTHTKEGPFPTVDSSFWAKNGTNIHTEWANHFAG